MGQNLNRKVLIVVNTFDVGGVEILIFNICNNIKKIEFHIFCNDINMDSYIVKELNKQNILISHFASSKNLYISIWKLWKIMRKNDYEAVHTNLLFFNWLVLFFAFLSGIKKRISHSHGYINFKKAKFHAIIRYYIKMPLKPLISLFATKLIAASKQAGVYLYGKNSNFDVIKNAIDIQKFAFNSFAREQFREKNNLQKQFIIGHVGRFSREKNHPFLIDIFYEIYKQNIEVVLMLAGDGKWKKTIEQKIINLGLQNNVKFVGTEKNVSELYQAMDCFIFPSFNEGLGIAVIEAQCSGLPCFISDGVPDEAAIINTTKIPLSKDPKEWADIILEKIKDFKRKDCSFEIKQAGFDIKDVIKQIEEEYLK